MSGRFCDILLYIPKPHPAATDVHLSFHQLISNPLFPQPDLKNRLTIPGRLHRLDIIRNLTTIYAEDNID